LNAHISTYVKYLLLCLIKIYCNVRLSGGTAPRLLKMGSRYRLVVSLFPSDKVGVSQSWFRRFPEGNSLITVLKFSTIFSFSRTLSQTLYRRDHVREVLSAGGGTGVADLPGLALQELQFSGQITQRHCPKCGQNAELQVMQIVPD